MDQEYAIFCTSGGLTGGPWKLSEVPLVIGRDRLCTISILDPLVSRRHCELAVKEGRVQVRDLGSRNTTLVNGLPRTEAQLSEGDEIAIGNIRFRVCLPTIHEREAPTPKLAQSTLNLLESKSYYQDNTPCLYEGRSAKQTVQSLADVYAFAQALWAAQTQEDLTKRAMEILRERFAPCCVRAILFNGLDKEQEVLREGAIPNQHAERCMALIRESGLENRGSITALPRVYQSRPGLAILMCAPLHLGQEFRGVIALISGPQGNLYDEHDLDLLMVIANLSAPWLYSLGRLEAIQQENWRLRSANPTLPGIVGESRAIRNLRGLVRRAAVTALTVLIHGETGVGKELVARMVHDCSKRRKGPFVAINCSAIPKELFESELFGHEKGAFTGADALRRGLIETCDKGTLFLDEVADLTPQNQVKLLRVIETGEFRRVGGVKLLSADFRLVAASNKSLPDEVSAGSFREDLYFRLNAFELSVPPLRDRPSDIPLLAQYFFEQVKGQARSSVRGFSDAALEMLTARRWRGNVRELRNAIERAVQLAEGELLQPEDFLFNGDTGAGPISTLETVEREHIERTLARCDDQVSAAARVLGISRTTLYEKIKRYGLRD